ncbi:hypothetical protein HMPREF0290_0527 [Corynebacterium efficiens YS-314]|uniref:CueP family metal-binding protein n=1 Tax=Corynebacterium efficiens TaxID=152794 RepID=UPI0001B86ADC|nr:CueP family metal-binding protein [Corynebacterium efficiens]EEW50875.1 hypothetical protein HMPREF0290_0527 [Corynebacterium efficiens YS-314]
MKRTAIILATLSLTLAGCSATNQDPAPTNDAADTTATNGTAATQDQFLASHGLADLDASQIIDHLDALPVAERPTDLIASVRTDELVLSDDNQELVLDLPENQTYVSIAPYLTQTHDCFYHSLTTCLGELGNEPVHVTITDEASGEVLVDEQATTFDNGFVGFWLPSETTGTIEITHQDRTGTTAFSTSDDGATCVTDLRMT